MTRIQAHRGASAYLPENTLESFSKALEMGADGIELDVHLSKDGHVVVAHDETLDRVSNGTGLIHDYTLAELKEFNFNKTFPNHPFVTIPTLPEVYELLKGSKATVNVEIKAIGKDLYPGLSKKLVDLEQEYSMGKRVIYSSFHHPALLELRHAHPSAKICLLYELGMVHPLVHAMSLGAYAIHPPYEAVELLPELVHKSHKNNVKVNVWTVNEPKAIKRMLHHQVDGIITNAPDLAVALRKKMEREARRPIVVNRKPQTVNGHRI